MFLAWTPLPLSRMVPCEDNLVYDNITADCETLEAYLWNRRLPDDKIEWFFVWGLATGLFLLGCAFACSKCAAAGAKPWRKVGTALRRKRERQAKEKETAQMAGMRHLLSDDILAKQTTTKRGHFAH